MPKAILEFNLPEESEEHLACLHGPDFSSVIFSLDQELRKWLKHGHSFKTADEAIEAAREHLMSLLEDRGVVDVIFG